MSLRGGVRSALLTNVSVRSRLDCLLPSSAKEVLLPDLVHPPPPLYAKNPKSSFADRYMSWFPCTRQELLATLLNPKEEGVGIPGPGGTKSGSETKVVLAFSGPSVAQARGVVEPLESALQIYTDMKNASQAAACHYQVRGWVEARKPPGTYLGGFGPPPFMFTY